MSYGKVISGGKAMTNGLTKGINNKLKGFEEATSAVRHWLLLLAKPSTKTLLSITT
jgi:hypothetical protein